MSETKPNVAKRLAARTGVALLVCLGTGAIYGNWGDYRGYVATAGMFLYILAVLVAIENFGGQS